MNSSNFFSFLELMRVEVGIPQSTAQDVQRSLFLTPLKKASWSIFQSTSCSLCCWLGWQIRGTSLDYTVFHLNKVMLSIHLRSWVSLGQGRFSELTVLWLRPWVRVRWPGSASCCAAWPGSPLTFLSTQQAGWWEWSERSPELCGSRGQERWLMIARSVMRLYLKILD